jgi:hypothetical protein
MAAKGIGYARAAYEFDRQGSSGTKPTTRRIFTQVQRDALPRGAVAAVRKAQEDILASNRIFAEGWLSNLKG